MSLKANGFLALVLGEKNTTDFEDRLGLPVGISEGLVDFEMDSGRSLVVFLHIEVAFPRLEMSPHRVHLLGILRELGVLADGLGRLVVVLEGKPRPKRALRVHLLSPNRDRKS